MPLDNLGGAKKLDQGSLGKKGRTKFLQVWLPSGDSGLASVGSLQIQDLL
jgi:hypothetical protein